MSEHHGEMVHEIRKIVANIEEMYKDVRDYFRELGMGFVF